MQVNGAFHGIEKSRVIIAHIYVLFPPPSKFSARPVRSPPTVNNFKRPPQRWNHNSNPAYSLLYPAQQYGQDLDQGCPTFFDPRSIFQVANLPRSTSLVSTLQTYRRAGGGRYREPTDFSGGFILSAHGTFSTIIREGAVRSSMRYCAYMSRANTFSFLFSPLAVDLGSVGGLLVDHDRLVGHS
ncbi:unnamed protein product [Arctogadus glacialis]